MTSWLKRLAAVFAAAFLTIGFGVQPAQAATVYECPEGHVCLYDWVNFNTNGGGLWHTHVQNIYTAPGDCINLTGRYFDEGGATVYDHASSLIANLGAPSGSQDQVIFYEWVNCNSSGRQFTVSAQDLTMIGNLGSVPWAYNPEGGQNFNNTIASIKYLDQG